jgi:hypothetical protein
MNSPFKTLNQEVAINFRDQLRTARAAAFRDSEAFQDIVYVLERMGAYLLGQMKDLGRYRHAIHSVADKSPMSVEVPSMLSDWHTPFALKYEIVREARNAALHEGAVARHLTGNAVELSLVLEEALMNGHYRVSDFMVRNPVCAYLWQPLSFIRQIMLVNSFSYLPVQSEHNKKSWQLISDFSLAQYLRGDGDSSRERLIQTLHEVLKSGKIDLVAAKTCNAQDNVNKVLRNSNGSPSLVLASDGQQLIGIVAAFDLL